MKSNNERKVALSFVAATALIVGLIFLAPGFASGASSDLYQGTGTPAASATGPTTYTVTSTDTLGAIALAHRVTVVSILEANPSITDPRRLRTGQQISIPAPNLQPGESIWAGYNFATASGLPATGGTPGATGLPSTGGTTYTVTPVDTLSGIAVTHGVTVVSILQANPSITNANVIRNGQQIALPAPNLQPGQSVWAGYNFGTGSGLPSTGGTPSATGTPSAGATGIPSTGGNPNGPTTYVVQPTDTLSGIAQTFHVTVVSLMQANPSIANPNILFNGQRINVPAPNLQPGQSIWTGYNFGAFSGLPATGGTPSASNTQPASTTQQPTNTPLPTATTTPVAPASNEPTATATP